MNKKDFIKTLAEKADLSIKQATLVFDETFTMLADLLLDGDKFLIPGFGSFATKMRAARMGRNPSTGKEMPIPESVAVAFKVAAALKESLNKK